MCPIVESCVVAAECLDGLEPVFDIVVTAQFIRDGVAAVRGGLLKDLAISSGVFPEMAQSAVGTQCTSSLNPFTSPSASLMGHPR